MNVLLTEVNKKLGECSVGSRSVILPMIYNIIEELEWTMSLSEETSDCVKKDSVDCTYSGAFTPPASLSNDSLDADSFSWDHSDFYKIYYDDEADYEDEDPDDVNEDRDEKMFGNDDYGPVQSSVSSLDESSSDEEQSLDLDVGEKCQEVTDVLAEDDCARFVT